MGNSGYGGVGKEGRNEGAGEMKCKHNCVRCGTATRSEGEGTENWEKEG